MTKRSEPGQRMFAVSPPPHALEDVDEFLEPRRAVAPFRWTGTDQLHITLAFLASVPVRRLDELGDWLERAASRRTPFTLQVAGGGAFPHPAAAKVLYAGLWAEQPALDELELTALGARAAATRAGIDVEGQRWRPHLTVAGINRGAEVTNWVRPLDDYKGPTWTVEQITLIASHLGEGPRGRPRYETVAELALG